MVQRVFLTGDKHDNAKAAKQIAEAIEEYHGIGLEQVLNLIAHTTGNAGLAMAREASALLKGLLSAI